MDASRTGCTTPSADNVEAAIGYFKGGKYVAPNGKVYGRNSIVAKTARAVLDAQPAMARVKEVVAYSTHSMAWRKTLRAAISDTRHTYRHPLREVRTDTVSAPRKSQSRQPRDEAPRAALLSL